MGAFEQFLKALALVLYCFLLVGFELPVSSSAKRQIPFPSLPRDLPQKVLGLTSIFSSHQR